jgi:hypothetical protein
MDTGALEEARCAYEEKRQRLLQLESHLPPPLSGAAVLSFFFYGPRLLQLVFFFRCAYAEKRQRLLQLVSLLPPLSGAAVLSLLSLLSQLALLATTSKY